MAYKNLLKSRRQSSRCKFFKNLFHLACTGLNDSNEHRSSHSNTHMISKSKTRLSFQININTCHEVCHIRTPFKGVWLQMSLLVQEQHFSTLTALSFIHNSIRFVATQHVKRSPASMSVRMKTEDASGWNIRGQR